MYRLTRFSRDKNEGGLVVDVEAEGQRAAVLRVLPDDEFVTLEIVHDTNAPAVATETRLSHLVVQVESMDATLAELAARGIETEPPSSPDGSDDFRTTWIADPDGTRIEIVQWPAGHAAGMSAADFER